jgi:hypothetical protein
MQKEREGEREAVAEEFVKVKRRGRREALYCVG